MYAIVNLGSNLGNRSLNLSRAMAAIMARFGDIEMSHAVYSAPQGFDSTHEFLNTCIMFRTDMDPLELLHTLQQIEQRISPTPHRDDSGAYIDRVIDIDIIALDDRVIDTPELTVPHPRLAERRFYLEPLREVAPSWAHPVTGLTADEMISALPDTDTLRQATTPAAEIPTL